MEVAKPTWLVEPQHASAATEHPEPALPLPLPDPGPEAELQPLPLALPLPLPLPDERAPPLVLLFLVQLAAHRAAEEAPRGPSPW